MSDEKLLDDLRKMRDFCHARHLSGVDCDAVIQRVRETLEDAGRQRALREAFEDGALWRWRTVASGIETPAVQARHEAARLYPITRTVPRVVTDRDGDSIRIVNGVLQIRDAGDWGGFDDSDWDTDALRDLLTNPFDEVTE